MRRVALSLKELLFGPLVNDYNSLSVATPSTASKDTAAQWGKTNVTCSQGEASLLSAGPEQQMLGMNISGIPSPCCATISMNQMWRAKIFTSCVSRGSRLHTLATACVIDMFRWTGLYFFFLLLLKHFG